MDDDTIAFGEEEIQNGTLRHPIVTLFHIGFKAAALVVYLFCGLFSASFIASFVTIILLLSMDFWTVKNITGRLMVGLRWWNYVDDNSKSHWIFESKKGFQNQINATESTIFWGGLIGSTALWLMFIILAFVGLKFKWFLLDLIALILNGANLWGYIKCKMGGDKNISTVTTDFLRKQVVQNVATMMTKSPPTTANQQTNII